MTLPVSLPSAQSPAASAYNLSPSSVQSSSPTAVSPLLKAGAVDAVSFGQTPKGARGAQPSSKFYIPGMEWLLGGAALMLGLKVFGAALGFCVLLPMAVAALGISFLPGVRNINPLYWAYKGVKGLLGGIKHLVTKTIPGWFKKNPNNPPPHQPSGSGHPPHSSHPPHSHYPPHGYPPQGYPPHQYPPAGY